MSIACSVLIALPAYSQQQTLSDPEIASIAVTANQVDVNAGELAKSKTKSKEVENFANTMINDQKVFRFES
ncbi:MAG TPA: DUF4142 domain-containing protein [Segetibacter sp.]